MEGGYDPVLNPDQNVEFRFNDNDVDVMIKKEVHAIYKYEHNAITEDEMRSELGKDPIADADREKMFVELITRENLRVEAECDTQVAQASASQTGTAETNNKSKNQGGKSSGGTGNKKSSSSSSSSSSKSASAKNSFDTKTIGLIKDSIDNMENSMDNYIKECFGTNTQILQSKMMSKITACGKDVIYLINKDGNISDIKSIEDKIIKQSTWLINQISKDMNGTNTYATKESSIVDTVNISIGIFKDSLIKYITNYHTGNTIFIERSP
jgi:hypothetical protein